MAAVVSKQRVGIADVKDHRTLLGGIEGAHIDGREICQQVRRTIKRCIAAGASHQPWIAGTGEKVRVRSAINKAAAIALTVERRGEVGVAVNVENGR